MISLVSRSRCNSTSPDPYQDSPTICSLAAPASVTISVASPDPEEEGELGLDILETRKLESSNPETATALLKSPPPKTAATPRTANISATKNRYNITMENDGIYNRV